MNPLVHWLIPEAEVALWPAWQDGLPFTGPGVGRDRPLPLLVGKSSITITETFEATATTGHGWTGSEMAGGATYQIAIEFPDGTASDEWGVLMSRIHPGGYRILTVRFEDETTGLWRLLSFYYVVPATDTSGESGQLMTRSLVLRSSWLQEKAGSTTLPSMEPVVIGEVDWICGTQRITALEYNPLTETWSSTFRNQTGDGSRYVTLTPISEDEGADVVLACYLPRVSPAPVVGERLPTLAVTWQNTAVLRISNQDSTLHHGLTIQAGHVLQAIGIVEPLVHLPQARVLDEPIVVFRFLRRIYATLGHGVLAVPRLIANEDPQVSLDYAFRIAATGPANPATGQAGLVILPNGAWLDGTLRVLP